MSIPEVLKRYALVNPVTVSERRVISVFDTVNQSVAAGATQETYTQSAASVASTPAIGHPGTDIVLTPGQVLLLESFLYQFVAMDASGKLRILSCQALDSNFNPVLPLKSNTGALPFTFAPAVNDPFVVSADPACDDELVIDPDTIALSGAILNLQLGVAVQNLDGAAAHVYQRELYILYRIISGVDPGTPRVISLD